MSEIELFNKTKEKIEKMFECLDSVKETHPYVVVMLLHDLARNIYPSDPFIPFEKDIHRLDYINKTVPEYIDTINCFKKWGGYTFKCS